MFIRFLLATLILFSVTAQAKLLDKIVAVVDDQIITLSKVNRVQKNLGPRKNISPIIFSKNSYTNREIVEILINTKLVRDKLSELGYVIGDDQVENQIRSTEERVGFSRNQLLQFLKSNAMTFDEYFELTRESMEYNIFVSRVITPLISITEQELKNAFYKENIGNKTLSFKYTLVDFSMPKAEVTRQMLNNFTEVLKKFQIDGRWPDEYKHIQTNVLGDISEDGLTGSLRTVLKKTEEGSFSPPILLGDEYHSFYVKKKDLVESELFQRAKNQIRAKLFEKRALQLTDIWFEREQSKHYVKYFL